MTYPLWTLVRDKQWIKDMSRLMLVQIAEFDSDDQMAGRSLGDYILRAGGFVFNDISDATSQMVAENRPPKIPGVTTGVLGDFDYSICIGKGKQSSPVYLPKYSKLRVEQAVLYDLVGRGHPVAPQNVWSKLAKLMPDLELKQVERAIDDMIRCAKLDTIDDHWVIIA